MGVLTVTYLGQCGFLLDFGSFRIVTDPYLSDFVDQRFYSPQTPWQRLYPPPADLAALKPDGVLISHSHEDHMDPWTLGPYFAKGGGCPVAVPAPECGKAESMGVRSLIPARAEEPFFMGLVQVTPIPCAHTQLHTDELGRFRELSYLIAYEGAAVFFGGDMSLYDGLEKRLREAGCGLLLLPANGGDEERTQKGVIGNIDQNQAAGLAAALHVPFVPMHHDLYAFNGCTAEEILAAAKEKGAAVHLLKPMESLRLSNNTILCG